MASKRSHDDDNNTALSRKTSKKQQDKGSPSSSAAANTNPNGKVFTCKICQKSFPSGRALGGHASSHNKYKCIIINTIEEDMKNNAKSDPENSQQEIKDDVDDGDDSTMMTLVESSKGEESYDDDGGGDDDDDDDDDDSDDDDDLPECKQCEEIFRTHKLLAKHIKKNHAKTEKRLLDIDLNNVPCEGDSEDSD